MAVLTLATPVTVNDKRYEALTLRRARTKDVRYLDRSGCLDLMLKLKPGEAAALPPGLLDQIAPFLAQVADVDEAVIDALDAQDFFALFELIEEVLPQGPLSDQASSTGKGS